MYLREIRNLLLLGLDVHLRWLSGSQGVNGRIMGLPFLWADGLVQYIIYTCTYGASKFYLRDILCSVVIWLFHQNWVSGPHRSIIFWLENNYCEYLNIYQHTNTFERILMQRARLGTWSPRAALWTVPPPATATRPFSTTRQCGYLEGWRICRRGRTFGGSTLVR